MRTQLISFALLLGASLILTTTACTQSEVIADKLMKQLNEKIGKYDVRIKDAEKKLKQLKAAQRKAQINAKVTARTGTRYEDEVKQAKAQVKELSEKLAKVEAIKAKGAPYKTSKGRELTVTQVNTLKIKVQTRLKIAQSKLRNAERGLKVSKSSSAGNSSVSDHLALKIAELEGKIAILKDQLRTLNNIKAQRKLKSEYDDEGTMELLKSMDRDISELESTIDVDVEDAFRDATSTEVTGNNGLSSSDVELIDEL